MVWAYPVGKVAALLLSRVTGDGPGNKNGVARWETMIGCALIVADPIGAGVLMTHGYVRIGSSDKDGDVSPLEKRICQKADKAIQVGIAIKSAGTLGGKLID